MPWLWVPDTQRFDARNWNLAASGAAFTASRVAKSVVVSTPLRTGPSVRVMVGGPFGFGGGDGPGWIADGLWRFSGGSADVGVSQRVGRPGRRAPVRMGDGGDRRPPGQPVGLGFDQSAQSLLEGDELLD